MRQVGPVELGGGTRRQVVSVGLGGGTERQMGPGGGTVRKDCTCGTRRWDRQVHIQRDLEVGRTMVSGTRR